jgi:hypothetical protein
VERLGYRGNDTEPEKDDREREREREEIQKKCKYRDSKKQKETVEDKDAGIKKIERDKDKNAKRGKDIEI